MGLFGSSTQIGVSIGTSSIKVAVLKKAGKSVSLEHFGVAQLPDQAVINREIVNHMAVVDALKGLVKELSIKGKNVIIGLSGSAVVVKKILLEQTPDRELEDAIMWEAEQYIPFDINEVVFDFEVVNRNGPEGKMEVVLVACKKSIVESYQAVIRDAGLRTETVDVDLFALENCFEYNYPQESAAALVDIGSSSIKMLICGSGQPFFTREASIGGRNLTDDIMKHLNLSFQEAEMLKIDGNNKGEMPQEVAELVNVLNENLASEIKRSVDFFMASNQSLPIGYVLLSGGSSKLQGLSKTVEEMTGLPTSQLNPFTEIVCNPKYFTDESIDAIMGVAAIPVGLALRGLQ